MKAYFKHCATIYDLTVDLIQNQDVVGLEVDRERIDCPQVISNADVNSAYRNLLICHPRLAIFKHDLYRSISEARDGNGKISLLLRQYLIISSRHDGDGLRGCPNISANTPLNQPHIH